MVLKVIIILYILLAIGLVVGLLINGVRPSKTLAWLLAIFTIPVGGILFYLMLGRNHRKKKLLALREQELVYPKRRVDPSYYRHSDKFKKLMHLVNTNCFFPPTPENNVALLKDGETTFDSIFNALKEAREFIHLQYYIFEEGELATKLLHLFQEKVKEGVVIRMIYDSIGSYTLSRSFLNQLQKIGVEVYPFLPFSFGRYLTSLNYRNHRKIIIVDGITAFTGGINVSDKYLKGDERLGMWHDMHLRLDGPAALQLDDIFRSDWFMVSQQALPLAFQGKSKNPDDGKLVQIVHSGPEHEFPTIEQAFLSIINEAEFYVYITNPYIIPSQEILQSLQIAALSGVDIRLLISKKSDSRLVNWSVRSFWDALLKAGVRIFLFPEGFLHSKIIVSDDDISSVGTANIDVRSFEYNYEVSALVYDTSFAQLLKHDFLDDCLNSDELDYQNHMKRPWTHRLYEGIARIFAPVL
ncbi:MAG: cardiolipin synthase [Flavobacteriaceae bacterium]|nr:cardiolipin synthase [Flavobacteriaceae bacterium]MDH3795665.1 cardiolipin synthase [Flavobacteriaceae bacterium]